jgi:hypothetical protein
VEAKEVDKEAVTLVNLNSYVEAVNRDMADQGVGGMWILIEVLRVDLLQEVEIMVVIMAVITVEVVIRM